MWLLCHARGCTVSEVHAAHSAELAALVAERARELPTCHGGGGGGRGGVRSASEVRGLLDRLEAYSLSMPSVVPSKELALAELEHRNLWFRRRGVANGRPQPLLDSWCPWRTLRPPSLAGGLLGVLRQRRSSRRL